MKFITNKWPHVVIVGERVSTENALDFILKTDSFLTSSSKYGGGNNHEFNEKYKKDTHLDTLISDPDDISGIIDAENYIKQSIGYLDLSYFGSNWASCSYVGGPHGIVSPSGEVYFNINIGKYPSNEEVLSDLNKIAEAFPWLSFKGCIYNDEQHSTEHNDSDIHLFSFIVKDGTVEIVDEDFGFRSKYVETFDFVRMFSNPLREQGIPNAQLEKIKDKVRAAVEKYKNTQSK